LVTLPKKCWSRVLGSIVIQRYQLYAGECTPNVNRTEKRVFSSFSFFIRANGWGYSPPSNATALNRLLLKKFGEQHCKVWICETDANKAACNSVL